jgi:hypothetical protein
MKENLELDIKCVYCNKVYRVKGIKSSDYHSWKKELGLIEDLMPYLSSADRELLLSSTCDECWKSLYVNDEIKVEE